eukprot:Rmarinus@m.27210
MNLRSCHYLRCQFTLSSDVASSSSLPPCQLLQQRLKRTTTVPTYPICPTISSSRGMRCYPPVNYDADLMFYQQLLFSGLPPSMPVNFSLSGTPNPNVYSTAMSGCDQRLAKQKPP